ncbi:MAG: hypothetical protein QXP36_05415 [Conexivisphaerales archaeon]
MIAAGIGSFAHTAATFPQQIANLPQTRHLITPAERWYYNNYLLPQTKAIDDAYAQTIKAKNAQIQQFQHSQLNQSATSNSLLSEASGYLSFVGKPALSGLCHIFVSIYPFL